MNRDEQASNWGVGQDCGEAARLWGLWGLWVPVKVGWDRGMEVIWSPQFRLFSGKKKKVEKKIDCSLLQTQWLQIILKISFLWKNLYTN